MRLRFSVKGSETCGFRSRIFVRLRLTFSSIWNRGRRKIDIGETVDEGNQLGLWVVPLDKFLKVCD